MLRSDKVTTLLGACALCTLGVFPSLHSTERTFSPDLTISETLQRLRAIEIPEDEEVIVPEPVMPLLIHLKHQLRDLIAKTLNQPDEHGATAAQYSKATRGHLKDMGVDVVPVEAIAETDFNRYGYIEDIRIEQPAGREDLLAAITTLQIPCGNDSSFYLFERRGEVWKLLLYSEINGYKGIDQAQSGFDYAVSPRDETGRWYVIVKRVNAWCTSVWHDFQFRVLRPGPDPEHPQVIFEHRQAARMDEPINLEAHRTWFRVSFKSWRQLDFTRNFRDVVLEYSVSADRVKRVPPIAWSPEDFVDEWLSLSWEEASAWVGPERATELKEWHARLGGKARESYSSQVQFVQSCGLSPEIGRWLIGVDLSPELRVSLPSRIYFLVFSKGEDLYYLSDINADRPPGCPGETPPDDP